MKTVKHQISKIWKFSRNALLFFLFGPLKNIDDLYKVTSITLINREAEYKKEETYQLSYFHCDLEFIQVI